MTLDAMPELTTLLLTREDHVLYITLNRPDCRNAMSLQMVNELSRVLDSCRDDLSIRALVLRGANQHFCAGGDIKDMAQARATNANSETGEDPFIALNRRFGTVISQLDQQPQVVIAVLEGAVLGGGFGLACVSDVAIAAETAQFGMPETGLGIIPAQIAPFVVTRIGLTQARRLTLLGARFDGVEAARLGLVHYAVPAEQLEPTLTQVVDQVRRCAPNANRVTKALLHKVGQQPMEALLDDAATAFAAAVQSAEGAEGTMAFVQKRLPTWATPSAKEE